MSIEISLLSELRKSKLLDIEQIILDLNVSTYISLSHPLNHLQTRIVCETIKENILSFRNEDIKQILSPTFERWPQYLYILSHGSVFRVPGCRIPFSYIIRS